MTAALAVLDRHVTTGPNPAAVYLSRLAAGSQRGMLAALKSVASVFAGQPFDPLLVQWHLVRYEHAQAARSALAAKYAPATVNLHLAALRGVLKECWRLGLMTAEELARAADVASIRAENLPAGREVSFGELRSLFRSVSDPAAGAKAARDAALLGLLYGCGLRRSEAVALDVADWNPATEEVTIRNGKGHKARLVYAKGGTATALKTWLVARGSEPGPLISPIRKGGQVQMRRMSAHNVFHIVRRLASQAAVGKFSPHDLRRSFVSHLLDASADLASVQQLAGHASIATTARYDRRGERAKAKTAGLLHVPFGD